MPMMARGSSIRSIWFFFTTENAPIMPRSKGATTKINKKYYKIQQIFYQYTSKRDLLMFSKTEKLIHNTKKSIPEKKSAFTH